MVGRKSEAALTRGVVVVVMDSNSSRIVVAVLRVSNNANKTNTRENNPNNDNKNISNHRTSNGRSNDTNNNNKNNRNHNRNQ
jgi:hypothetical protein